MRLQTVNILCQGGVEPWSETDENTVTDVLEPNEIFGNVQKQSNTYFIEVNTSKTNIQNMYSYDEIDPEDTDILCWRRFYRLIDASNEKEWISWLPCNLKPYLDSINNLKTKSKP